MQLVRTQIRKYIICILLCFCALHSYTQIPEFAPVGAKWWYAYQPEFSFNNQYYLYEAVKDTIIEGEDAVRINASVVLSEDSIIYRGYEYFKKDSTQIAIYRNDAFHTLINYNVEAGDTITVLNENFEAFFFPEFNSLELNNFSYAIDSIEFEMIDGIEYKIINIQNLPESDYTFYDHGTGPQIIETIGATSGLCMVGLPSDIGFTNPIIYGLVCYKDNERTLSFNGFSCDALFTGIESNISSSQFSLVVQNGSLYISTAANNTFQVSIYDMQGALLMKENFYFQKVIPLSSMNNKPLLISIQTPQKGIIYNQIIYSF